MQVVAVDSCAGVLNAHNHSSCHLAGRDLQRRIRCAKHRILGVQQQVQDNLLQFALVAMDFLQQWIEVGLDAYLHGLKLVLQQRQAVKQQLVEIDAW